VKRWFPCLLAICLLVAMLPTAMMASAAAKTYDFTQLAGYYKTQGRVQIEANALNMDTSSSGFEFYFKGSGDVSMGADFKCTYTNNMFLTVIVDGARSRMEIVNTSSGVSQYHLVTLASGLSDGYHHIEVYKQTEASSALMTVWGVTFDGTPIVAPPEDQFTMEVVGDSISGGASNLATNSTANASYPVYQDGTQTYAYFVGEDIGANVRVTQTSGYGCCGGWNSQGTGLNLQDMYPYTSYWRDHTNNGLYDFNPPADIVVINLGTNDYSAAKYGRIDLTPDQFKAGAINLMTMAKTKNNGAKVVWCTGMMGITYQTELTAAVKELGGADAGYFFCILPENTEGGEGHPTVAGHRAAAESLKTFLINNVLPADYSDKTVVLPQLKIEIERAKEIANPTEALTQALELAQMEVDCITSDPYRLGYRYFELRKAIDGYTTGIDLMPIEGVTTAPQTNGHYVWPYYAADSVTLYKGGTGLYWPYLHTEYATVVDLDATPYLTLETASTAEWNVHIAFKDATGTARTITATDAMGGSTVNFAADSTRKTITVPLKEYLASFADANGCITVTGCDLYVVGDTDTYVTFYRCAITSDNGGIETTPTRISGDAYPLTDGVVSRVPAGTTAAALTAAMNDASFLRVVKVNGTPVSGALGTGMLMQLVVNEAVVDTVIVSVIGDVTGDGELTTLDAREAMLYSLMDDYPLTAAEVKAADESNDGTVTTTDVRNILLAALSN